MTEECLDDGRVDSIEEWARCEDPASDQLAFFPHEFRGRTAQRMLTRSG